MPGDPPTPGAHPDLYPAGSPCDVSAYGRPNLLGRIVGVYDEIVWAVVTTVASCLPPAVSRFVRGAEDPDPIG